MKRFRKATSLLLVGAMALSLVACGKKEEPATTQEVTTREATTEATEEQTTEAAVEEGGNLLTNGDLSNDTTDYFIYTNGGNATMEVNADGQLQVDIKNPGSVEHGVQIYHDGFSLKQNAEYEISFDVASTVERDIDMRFQLNGGDYHAYYIETIHATPQMQHVDYKFTMEEATDPAPRLCFNMGNVASMEEAGIDWKTMEEHSVMFDNFELYCVDDSNASDSLTGVEAPKVKVNQVGYRPNDIKTVVFSDIADDAYEIVDVSSDKSVYEGTIGKAAHCDSADEAVSIADFSDFKDDGTYKVVTSSGEESYEFTISKNPYEESFDDIVKMLYMQRCGEELTKDMAGDFAHPACHTTKATVYGTNDKIDVNGGWHDAGDYGRYVVSGAKAVADILLAYEKNPKAFGDDLGIPESGNGVSDILDEAKYELEWMMKMQNKEGGVYHKVTCEVFPEMVMPQDETAELIVCPVSNTATGDYAAVMAMAARVYGTSKDKDMQKFAKSCQSASEKAYQYLGKHLDEKGFKNPGSVVTGEYPDDNCTDEYFWAAAELYKTTGDTSYMKDLAKHYKDVTNYTGLGWADVGGFGSYALLTASGAAEENADVYKAVYDAFMDSVEEVLKNSEANGYMINRDDTFEWGSNMGIANDGMLLLLANDIKADENYMVYAKHHLDYLFGVNATGYCFVTGVGSQSPTDPHHRPSQAVGECMPGMLVGGADSNLEDPYAQAVCKDMPAAKCYVDNSQSYSMNEVTIYWNSPLIYLLSATEK